MTLFACALHRGPTGRVGRAGTPDDFSYSSDIVQDTKNRLQQLESEAEVRNCFCTLVLQSSHEIAVLIGV